MVGPARRAVFLDRDGVINRSVVRNGKPYPPDSVDSMEILPGVAEALSSLRGAGYLNIVVTNQPDVATGKQTRVEVEAIHARMRRDLAIDDIRVCYHVDSDNCACRKPRPGMLVEAAREHAISLAESHLVGDRWRDIEAGQAAGCRTNFFIDYGYAEKRPDPPFVSVKSLVDAARHILDADTLTPTKGELR